VKPELFASKLEGEWSNSDYTVVFSRQDNRLCGVISGPLEFKEYLQFSKDFSSLQVTKSGGLTQTFLADDQFHYRDKSARIWHLLVFKISGHLSISAFTQSGDVLSELYLEPQTSS
jgi:hypothetical protein